MDGPPATHKRLLPNERNVQAQRLLDGLVESLHPFRCAYCRAICHAEDLADSACGDGVIMCCTECVDRKRSTNNAYAKTYKGRLCTRRSRRKHRAAQRERENEIRRRRRAVARASREAHAQSVAEAEIARLVAAWNEVSDAG